MSTQATREFMYHDFSNIQLQVAASSLFSLSGVTLWNQRDSSSLHFMIRNHVFHESLYHFSKPLIFEEKENVTQIIVSCYFPQLTKSESQIRDLKLKEKKNTRQKEGYGETSKTDKSTVDT